VKHQAIRRTEEASRLQRLDQLVKERQARQAELQSLAAITDAYYLVGGRL
jgi:hypothetical protein